MKDSKIKVGDFVAIRVKDTEYDYDSDKMVELSSWNRHGMFGIVVAINGDNVECKTIWVKNQIANIKDCIKMSKEDIQQFIELKGTDKLIPDFPKIHDCNIKAGDIVKCDFHYKMEKKDYLVLKINDKLAVLTRPNKYNEMFVVPKNSCFKEENAQTD